MADNFVCAFAGCDKKKHAAFGFCDTHYMRIRRNGDVNKKKKPRGEHGPFIANVIIPFDGDECLIWPFYRSPQGVAKTSRNGQSQIVSRVVCERVYGPPPTDKHEAAHSCGKAHEGCVNPKHLRWATPVENAQDKLVHGTNLSGERHNMAKLCWQDVTEIRMLKGYLSQREIGDMYGVNKENIGYIHRGKRWKEYVS
jgi:hypothetical protein